MEKALDWIEKRLEKDPDYTPTPIGFYFAKLWYFEALYPKIFLVGGLEKMKLAIQIKPKHVKEKEATQHG